MGSLHDIRRDYAGDPLPDDPIAIDPWRFFAAWVSQAVEAGEPEPTAMTLATIGGDLRRQHHQHTGIAAQLKAARALGTGRRPFLPRRMPDVY